MTYETFTPTRPRATKTVFRGVPGVHLTIPGKRSSGVFIADQHIDQVIDEIDQEAAS